MNAQRVDLLKQQKEAQKELEVALKGLGQSTGGGGGSIYASRDPAASVNRFSLSSLADRADESGW